MQTQLDVQAKIRRFAQLRSSLRVIEASRPDAPDVGLESSFQQLRGWLAELRSLDPDSGAAGPAALSSAQFELIDNVDRMLDELERAIVEEARTIPLAQLRATLPAIKRQHPEALAALLDLCLVGHSRGTPWWNVIDYLITLLASEEKDGRRFVARDPTGVTPLLQEMCSRAERQKTGANAALAQLFRDASLRLERGVPSGPIVSQMRSAKHQAMEVLLVPDLLRALTDYNVAVANQRSELIETQRVLEQAELAAFEAGLGSAASERKADPPRVRMARREAPTAAPEAVQERVEAAATSEAVPAKTEPTATRGAESIPPVAPIDCDVLESLRLRAIVAAVGATLRREDPGEGPDAELAEALDTSRLSAAEASALRSTRPSTTETLIATAAVVGLIVRELGRVGEIVARAGISAEQLRGEWVSALENRLRTQASVLISSDEYDEARLVAEVRTRLLRKPEVAIDAWRLERDGSAKSPTPYASGQPSGSGASPAASPRPRRRIRIPRRVAMAAAILAVAGLAAVAVVRLEANPDERVAFYSNQELQDISFYIESGYRNGRGEGPAFVGTLRPQWQGLSAVERRELGRAIEAKLLARGVAEFWFFDEQRDLLLRYENGNLLVN